MQRQIFIPTTYDAPSSGPALDELLPHDSGTDPSTIGTGLLAWWKADAGVYKDAGVTLAADNDTVQQWNDQSGNSNNMTQTTSGNRPTYKTGIVNGLATVRFDRSAPKGMLTPVTIAALPHSIMLVARAFSAPSYQRFLQSTSNNWLFSLARADVSGNNGYYAGNWIVDNLGGLDGTNTGNWVCLIVTHSATSNMATLYSQGREVSRTGLTTVPATIALSASGFYDERVDGEYAEIAVYNNALSVADVMKLFGYVYNKYGFGKFYAAENMLPGRFRVAFNGAYSEGVAADNPTNAPEWGNFDISDGLLGEAYSFEWYLEKSYSPTTYALQSGTLPTGLSVTSPTGNKGVLSGTPTATGTFIFTLRATNAYGTADKSFTVVIGTSSSGGGGEVATVSIG